MRYFAIIALLGLTSVLTLSNSSEKDLSISASRYMWDQFHRGNYDSIPAILERLEKAYENDPEDVSVTSKLGYVHLWKFSERFRKEPDTTLAEHVALSNRYFKEAMELDPEDARLKGFQSVTDICEGALYLKLPMIAKGYINSFRSVDDWPQFNKFTVSLIGSQSNKNSLMYKLAIKYQWQLIDDCSCRNLDRKTIMGAPTAEFRQLFRELEASRDPLINRACKSSWIAPHNMEGFFLNFGDMLVKEGHFREAKQMYSAAKLCPTYAEWPYAYLINERIHDMKSNRKSFNRPFDLNDTSGETQLFINSEISCVACHQMSKKEFKNQNRSSVDLTFK